MRDWPHTPVPHAARRARDGRVALLFAVRKDSAFEQMVTRWYVLDAPEGQLRLTLLQEEDVEDWVEIDGVPGIRHAEPG